MLRKMMDIPNRIQKVAQVPETLAMARRTPTKTGITPVPMTTLTLTLGDITTSLVCGDAYVNQ